MSAGRTAYHPGTDSLYPPTYASSDLNVAFDLLGPPQSHVPYDSSGGLRSETWTLQHMFKGKQQYFEDLFSAMIFRTHNSWATRYIMREQYRGHTNFAWQKRHWQRTLPQRVAPRGVGEQVPYQSEQRTAHMVQYKLSWSIGSTELLTDEGQEIAVGHAINVALGFVELQQTLVVRGLLKCKMVARMVHRRTHTTYNAPAMVFAWMDRFAFVLQKTENGIERLISMVREIMRDVDITDAIVSEGTRETISLDRFKHEYYRHGPGSQEYVTKGADAVPAVIADVRLHVYKGIRQPDGRAPQDPLLRLVNHGRFETMDLVSDCVPSDYCSASRNIAVLDGTDGRGTMTQIDFARAFLDHSGRFVEDGGLGRLTAAHRKLADALNASSQGAAGGAGSMYLYQHAASKKYDVVSLLGHCEEWALPQRAADFTARTMAARVRLALGEDRTRALNKGLATVRRIRNKRLTKEDFANMQAWAGAPGEVNDEDAGRNILPGGDAGGPKGGADAPVDAMLPAGFGSVPGFIELAHGAVPGIDPALKREARDFEDAAVALYEVCRALSSPNHPAFDAALVPGYFSATARSGQDKKRQDSITTFLQNVVDHNVPPLLIKRAAVGGGGGGLGGAVNIGGGASEAVLAIANLAFPFAPPRLRAVLSDPGRFGEFDAQFTASAYGRAALGYFASRAARRAEEAPAELSFGQFMVRAVRDVLRIDLPAPGVDRPSQRGLARALDEVVGAVVGGAQFTPPDTVRSFKAWATAVVPDEVMGVESDATDYIVTRFVVDYDAFARTSAADDRANFAFASPYNASVILRSDDAGAVDKARAAARGNFEHAFMSSHAAYGDGGHDEERPWSAASARTVHAAASAAAPSALLPDYRESLDVDAVPSFGPSHFTSADDGGVLHTNENLVRRYNEASGAHRETLDRVCALLTVLAPVNRTTFARWLANDVSVPASVSVVRPDVLVRTTSIIFVVATKDLGELAWTALEILMSSDAATGVFRSNMSMWMVPIVKDESLVFIAENVAGVELLGGCGTRPHTPASFKAYRASGALTANTASAIYMSMPLGAARREELVSPHDIRGRFADDLIARHVTEEAYAQARAKPQYPEAAFYVSLYELGKQTPGVRWGNIHDAETFTGGHNLRNTVVERGVQDEWSYATRRVSHRVQGSTAFGYETEGIFGKMNSGQVFDKRSADTSRVSLAAS